jgi:hypothetical protein
MDHGPAGREFSSRNVWSSRLRVRPLVNGDIDDQEQYPYRCQAKPPLPRTLFRVKLVTFFHVRSSLSVLLMRLNSDRH